MRKTENGPNDLCPMISDEWRQKWIMIIYFVVFSKLCQPLLVLSAFFLSRMKNVSFFSIFT